MAFKGEMMVMQNVASKVSNSKISYQEAMIHTLDWAYEKTLTGVPGQKDIHVLVEDYLKKYTPDKAIKHLVNFQTTKAATAGFLTGVGGVITIPVSIPANVATVILFQMRMIAGIALIRGYDLDSDQVQTFVYATLAGTSVTEIMKRTGIDIGNKMALGIVKRVPGVTLKKINQAVGFRLVTIFGRTGSINLVKMVPIAGGLVGGVFDTVTTRAIARLANRTFSKTGIDIGDGTIIDEDKLKVELK